MQPTQERRIQTSAGLETASETVNRIQSARQSAPVTDIPVESLENTQPPLEIPQVGVSVPSADSIRSSGVPILDEATRQAQAEVDAAQTPVSQSEEQIRNLLGLQGQKSAVEASLRQEKGVTRASELVNSLVNNLRTQQANLADSDDIFEDMVQMERLQASGRDITKRTFGAMETEMRINRAIDRRSQMAAIRTTQASYYVATDNLEAAKAEVKEALDLIYDPIEAQLKAEMFFLQRSDARLSDARRELATAKGREIDFQLGEISRARSMVDMVVSNGFATPQEIQELGELSGSPRRQTALAQEIANRGAAQERGLRLEQLSLSIASSRAQLAKMSQPDANAVLMQNLFSMGQPTQSYQEFLEERGMANMSRLPEVEERLQEEYRASFAVDPNQQQQMLSWAVATGAMSTQQAEFLQKNLNIMTPDKIAKQKMTVMRGKTVLRDVDRSLDVLDGMFIRGAGATATQFIPGFGAFELKQHLDSIKSNISIDQLQAIRDASPTGAGLGPIPVQQQEYLMSVLGALKPNLPPNVLSENLRDVYNIYLDTMFGTPTELGASVKSGKMTATEANAFLQQRKATGFNDYNLPINMSMGQDIGNLVIAPNGDVVRIKD